MADMLVKLYDLPDLQPSTASIKEHGIVIRLARAYEMHQVTHWVGETFSRPWQAEVTKGICAAPPTVMLAIANETLVGFGCYDTTARGVAGPFGVDESHQGKGIGKALTLAVLHAMHAAGYAYAVIGSVGPADFYQRTVGAIPIPDSTPGYYHHRIDTPPRDV